MSHDQLPTQQQNIPHSGDLGLEKPVQEFPNTSLQDAVDQDLIVTPDSPAELHQSWFQKKSVQIGGAVLAAVAVAGGAFGLGKSSGEAPAPEKNPAATSTPVAGEGELPASEAPSTPEQPAAGDFGFSSETYASNPEQLMTDFATQFNRWQNTGYTDAAVTDSKRFEGENMDDATYAANLAEESDETFANSVFIPNWESNGNISTFYGNATELHKDNLHLALLTSPVANSENAEHYQRFIDITEGSVAATVNPDGSITGSFNYTGRDNSDQNEAEQEMSGVNPNNITGSFSVTFTDVDGSMRISDILVQSQS